MWWALLGLASGLLCLGRATSPVYIVPIFGVCSTVDLIANDKIAGKSCSIGSLPALSPLSGGLVLRQQIS